MVIPPLGFPVETKKNLDFEPFSGVAFTNQEDSVTSTISPIPHHSSLQHWFKLEPVEA